MNEAGEVDESLVRGTLDLEVFEENLRAEESQSLIDDVFSVAHHLGCGTRDISLDGADTDTRKSLEALVRAELRVVGDECRARDKLLQSQLKGVLTLCIL